jgi:general secretion pathway protein L
LAELAFIRLIDGQAGAAWATLDAQGHLASAVGRGSLEDARSAVAGRRVVVLLPGPDVVTTQVDLPAASQARLRQLAPYSLEDYVADDVEDLLFAVGAKFPSGATSVAVVARERLDAWLGELRSVGIAPQAVCSECDGVPDIPGTICLLVEGERIYGRRAGQPPFVFEGLGLEGVLEVLGAVHTTQESADQDLAEPPPPPPRPTLLVYTDQIGHARMQADLAALAAQGVDCDVKVLADGAFPHFASALAQHPGTNLLQGAYAPKANWRAYAKPWRVAAALAVVVAGLGLLSQGAEYLALRREAASLNDRVATACSRVVSATRLDVCSSQVRTRLGQAGAAPSAGPVFLSALGAVAASRDPALRIDALSYRNRVMDLQLVAANVSALDEFARALQSTHRYAAKIESTTNTDKGVEGRMQIAVANP